MKITRLRAVLLERFDGQCKDSAALLGDDCGVADARQGNHPVCARRLAYNGVACINITDDDEGQRVKNANAKRLVPIHDKLIELGLLRYVEVLRRQGETRLFPELNARRDGYAQAASNWFQRLKKRCGIDGKHTKVFHSFRHNFISSLLDDGVPEQAVAQIVGHEANLITGKVYWNARDAAKRKPTVDMYEPPAEVWRLLPKFEEITIVPRSGRKSANTD